MIVFDKIFRYVFDDNELTDVIVNWDEVYSIPEFAVLKTLHQSPKWHSESEFVSGHIEAVVKAAIEFVIEDYDSDGEYKLSDNDREILLVAALFHDIGKATTTFFKEKDQAWHHYGHEIEGEKLTRRILWDENISDRESVCQLVRWHMAQLDIIKKKSYIEDIVDLSKKVPSIKLLYLLKSFDMAGSQASDPTLTANDEFYLDTFFATAEDLGCAWSRSLASNEGVLYCMSKKPKILAYMYIGLPGAGKDTDIKKRFGGMGDKIAIISRDLIRTQLGYCGVDEKYIGTHEEEEKVTEIFNAQLLEAAQAGKTIVINNMNNKRAYRDSYKNVLKDFNVTWHYMYCEAFVPFGESKLAKNIIRRDGQIPAKAFPNMVEAFEMPTYDEYTFFVTIVS